MTNTSPSTGSDSTLFKVGELAEKTGLTVRTLHYYEEIGLLLPSYRTDAEHRLYTEGDIARLQQITSLKQMGMSLEQIKMMLEQPTFNPTMVIDMQLQRITDDMAAQEELLGKLKGLLRLMQQTKKSSAKDMLELIALMTKIESYYTPEQRDEIAKRAKTMGEGAIIKGEQDWAALIAEVKTEMEQGTDPTDPKVKALAVRWMNLVRAFTGGNKEIEANMKKMYTENPNMSQSFGGPDPQMMEYIQKAMQ